MAFVRHTVSGLYPETVVEFGARDINGSPRYLFPYSKYVGLDLEPGQGVDVIADATTWTADREYDMVLCLEVLEHTPTWQELVGAAHRALRAGGILVLTAATDPREPHSAIDGAALRPGEWYENIDPELLNVTLKRAEFDDIRVTVQGEDVQAVATKS